jgi:arylsulfatase A-like enzyme
MVVVGGRTSPVVGSPVETPNLDNLAEGGLRYTNMHTTALCSPTRACILTGRNHHSNAMACITELSTGYPGYNGYIPFGNGFLSEILLQQGYNTFMVGKYHLTPSEQESAAGSYDRWPLGRGFERYYGFLGGDTHQYYPDLMYDNHQVAPPRTPEEGYHLTEDLADQAIQFIADAKQVAPNKPFYLHFCLGAMHAPHHVPKEWADRYAGMFDDGWDAYREKVFARQKELGIAPAGAELSRHDPDVPDWNSLSSEAKKLYVRMMEVFAGFLTHTDYQTGRLLDFLKGIGEFDHTLIMVISDNGASAEGGPTGTTNEGQFFNNASRERLIGMIAAWYVEAGKYKVLPIDGSGLQRFAQERPQITTARTRYTYYPDTQTVPLHVAAKVLNRPHSITADVEIPMGGAEGVLRCQGTGAEAIPSISRMASCTMLTITWVELSTRLCRATGCRKAVTSYASSSSRSARRTFQTARARRLEPCCISMANW